MCYLYDKYGLLIIVMYLYNLILTSNFEKDHCVVKWEGGQRIWHGHWITTLLGSRGLAGFEWNLPWEREVHNRNLKDISYPWLQTLAINMVSNMKLYVD